jgi:histone H3/H4
MILDFVTQQQQEFSPHGSSKNPVQRTLKSVGIFLVSSDCVVDYRKSLMFFLEMIWQIF